MPIRGLFKAHFPNPVIKEIKGKRRNGIEINIHMSWPRLNVVEICKAMQAVKMHQRANIIVTVNTNAHTYVLEAHMPSKPFFVQHQLETFLVLKQ